MFRQQLSRALSASLAKQTNKPLLQVQPTHPITMRAAQAGVVFAASFTAGIYFASGLGEYLKDSNYIDLDDDDEDD
jgi:hypothetical protein